MPHDAAMVAMVWWALMALGGAATVVFVAGGFLPGARTTLYLSNLPMAPFFLIAAFLLWRRPRHRVARRMLTTGVCASLALALGEVLSVLWLTRGPQPLDWVLATASQVAELGGIAAAVGLVAVFPDGDYHRRHERWVVVAAALQVAVLPALLLLSRPTLAFDPYMIWARPAIVNPLHAPPLTWLGPALGAYHDSIFVWGVAGVLLLALRYRRLRPEQRLQVRWPLAATICFAGFVVLGLVVPGSLPGWLTQLLWDLVLPLFPLAIAIALLRYRLLDIDLVIRRSLVYGVLWLAIAMAYLALAAALGLAAGQRLPVALAILVTIGVTVAFQPARRWLERLADHWVFGERISGYQLLRRLGATLETTVDVSELGMRLAVTIRSALGLRWVRISTHRQGGVPAALDPVGWDGIAPAEAGCAEAIVPLAHGAELVGVIECGAKVRGELTETDRDLLATLARQAALALRNARLAADLGDQLELMQVQAMELAESRARIVRAQDEERNRIERDLHDGVQQQLVSLAARLRRATRMPAPDLQQAVGELAGEAEEAVFALQDFSRGVYPSVLADEGLAPALWSHAQRLPVSIELDVGPDVAGQRFGREREAALYFVALEAIVNAQKHASVERIAVVLRRTGTDLRIEVTDAGRGRATPTGSASGSGLQNMKDRVAALGGRLEILSQPGQGTRIVATVPDGLPVRVPAATPAGRSARPRPGG